MIVTVDKMALQRRLKVIERIAPRKGAGNPFFNVVHILVDSPNLVTLWVMNTNEGYSSQLVAEGEDFDAGWVAVPVQEFIRAVSAAPGSTVTISNTTGETFTRIQSGLAEWIIESMTGVMAAASDLEGDLEDSDIIDVGELTRILEATRYAASKTDSRPSFMQIHIGEGRAVAADGRRFHQTMLGEGGSKIVCDIPEKAVDTLLEALSADDGSGVVSISTDEEGAMTFVFGASIYEVGKLHYVFPDVDSLMLADARAQTGTLRVNLKEFVTAAKVAAVVIDDGGHITLRMSDDSVQIKGESARSSGWMDVPAGIDGVESGMKISVIASDLLEMIGRVESTDEITFTVGSGGSNPGWLFVADGKVEAAIRPVKI